MVQKWFSLGGTFKKNRKLGEKKNIWLLDYGNLFPSKIESTPQKKFLSAFMLIFTYVIKEGEYMTDQFSKVKISKK
jgi:hypothetical protein